MQMKEVQTKILILADDLTGALDSGVQFAGKGDEVAVRTDHKRAFDYTEAADVLVIDTETRHIPKEEAYDIVYRLTKEALAAGIRTIYKKTDSGLRGNVGAELKAVLDASGAERLEFVPAWPKMERITKDGIHYASGVPLEESIFSRDVIDPVTESHIDRLIHLQADVDVTMHGKEEGHGIVVYDCESEEELEKIAKQLSAPEGNFRFVAGCAGLLEKYPKQSERLSKDEEIRLDKELLVLSGSMNDITKGQLAYAEKQGMYRIHVPMRKIVTNTWTDAEIRTFAENFLKHSDTPVSIVDTMEAFGETSLSNSVLAAAITSCLGKLAYCLIGEGIRKTYMIIGGDTLRGFIREAGIQSLRPIREMAPGVVLAKYRNKGIDRYLITKSGAFGPEDHLMAIQKSLLAEKEF